jgi:hypothetical protein
MGRANLLKCVALAFLASSVAQAQSAKPTTKKFEYRGVHLGDSIPADAGSEAIKGMICLTDVDPIEGTTTCGFMEKGFAGIDATPVITLVDRKIARIGVLFDEKDFGTLADALKARWGAPSSSSAPMVQNRAGSSFQNLVYGWTFPEGTMLLERLGLRVDQGDLLIEHTRLVKLSSNRVACAKAKDAQKDLGGKLPAGCK